MGCDAFIENYIDVDLEFPAANFEFKFIALG